MRVSGVDARVLGVRHDRPQDVVGYPPFSQDLLPGRRMFLRRAVIRVGPAFVVEVVQQTGKAPQLLVLLELAGRRPASPPPRRYMCFLRFSFSVYSWTIARASSRDGISDMPHLGLLGRRSRQQ